MEYKTLDSQLYGWGLKRKELGIVRAKKQCSESSQWVSKPFQVQLKPVRDQDFWPMSTWDSGTAQWRMTDRANLTEQLKGEAQALRNSLVWQKTNKPISLSLSIKLSVKWTVLMLFPLSEKMFPRTVLFIFTVTPTNVYQVPFYCCFFFSEPLPNHTRKNFHNLQTVWESINSNSCNIHTHRKKKKKAKEREE